jgi:hypothetical protein
MHCRKRLPFNMYCLDKVGIYEFRETDLEATVYEAGT